MNTRCLAFSILPVLVVVGCSPATSAGDGDPDSGAHSSDYRKQALCDRYRGFMVDELGVTAPVLDKVSADERIGWSAACTIRRSDSLILGSLQVHNPRTNGEVAQPSNFRPVEGHGAKVWMADDDPHWTELRTQVGPWVTKIRFSTGNVRTSRGALAFGDKEISRTAEFLARITHDIQV